MRIIAIVNQKGGVGKTTTTCNLGAGLAHRGKRVLLVDLDAQAHLTFHLGIDNTQTPVTVYDLMTGRCAMGEVIVARSDRLHVAPSHIDLAGAEVELVSRVARERILRDALAPCADDYDVALVDCPPSLGLMTLNALVAADEIILTLQPHVLALQGMSKLLETAQLIRERLNRRLKISGVVFCMFDGRTSLSGEVVADVESFFAGAAKGDPLFAGVRVFDTRIRRNIKLAEAPGFGQTIFEYAPSSHGAEDYEHLTDELLGASTAAPAAEPGKGLAEPPEADDPASETRSGTEAQAETPGDLAATVASEPAAPQESPPPSAQGPSA